MGLARFVESVLKHAREAPAELARLPEHHVPGSIFSGAAGVAFFFHEAARLTDDSALLEPAERWLEAAKTWAHGATTEDWTGFPHGFLIGGLGLAYVEALLASRRGEHARVHAAIERIGAATARFDVRADLRRTEIVGGAAGAVLAVLDLEARLVDSEGERVRAALQSAREGLVAQVLAAHAERLDAGPKETLGAAHGVSGELFALLRALGADHPVVRARLDDFAARKQEDEEGFLYWLPNAGELAFDMLATWCNGTAGHALLWCERARQTGDAADLELARRTIESTSFLGAFNGGLCCGLAGHAIVLERYAQLAGDRRYTKRAYARLAKAAALSEARADDALGFWQGNLGVALAALKRDAGERDFPCIEPLQDPSLRSG